MRKSFFFFTLFIGLGLSSPLLSTEASQALTSVKLLEKLISFNTTNPPGNETPAMKWVQSYLNDFDIESQLIESAPGRGNLIARLPKNIRKETQELPLLFLAHLDVVPANAEEWNSPPFQPTILNDYIYGRGALDMKAQAALMIQTFVQLKLKQIPLSQDILLVLVADEEAGGKYGAEYLVKNYWQEIEPAAVLNEGSIGIQWKLKDKTLHLYPIQVAEKGVAWLKLTAHGTSGHGSMPTQNNATLRLIHALNRVTEETQAIEKTSIMEDMLKKLSSHFSFPRSWALKHFFSFPIKTLVGWFGEEQLQNNKFLNSMLRNTITPTVLKAGSKTNVIPATATAELDCRILPGHTPEGFRKHIIQQINDPQVEVEFITASLPNESNFHSPYYQALAQAIEAHDPQAIVIPYMSPGATDNRFFRDQGVPAFGIIPLLVKLEDIEGLHGKNERIPMAELARGEKILWDFVLKVQRTTQKL